MALLIEKTFGRDHILTLLDNPCDFLRSYQQAALQHPEKGWVFSEESLEYLRLLEERLGHKITYSILHKEGFL